MNVLELDQLQLISGGDGVGQAGVGTGMVVGSTVIAQGGVVTAGTVTGVGVGGVVTGIGAVPILTIGLAAGGGYLIGDAIGNSAPVQSASESVGSWLNNNLGWQGGLPSLPSMGGGIVFPF